MTNTNPYAYSATTVAAHAAADERATFLRRTYALLLAAVVTFAGTLWAAGNVEPVRQLAADLARVVFGNRWGIAVYLAISVGGALLVHAFAERRPINMVFFFAFAFAMGLLTAPLIQFVLARGAAGLEIINQAALLTTVVFGGLSIYVFYSGKDFSFMGGALTIAAVALFAIGLGSWLFGADVGTWYSVGIVVLFSGYVLYDTSNVLHHYPTTAYVSAACVLFVDVIMLFKNILMLMARRD